MHSSSTNCLVCNLHTSGNDAGHMQYGNVSVYNKLQPLIFTLIIFSCSISLFIDIYTLPTIQRHVITTMMFGCARTDQIYFSLLCASWPVNYVATNHGSAVSVCHESWKTWNNGCGFNLRWTHHWKVPLFIRILNRRVTLNKRKSYHSVASGTISNEKRWLIVAP